MALKSFTAWWLYIFMIARFLMTVQAQPKGFASEETTGLRLTEQAEKVDEAEHAHRLKRQLIQKVLLYNIIYVVDSSSSMKDVDFRHAIEAIRLLTAKARPNTRYAAVIFATHAQVISTFTTPAEIVRKLRAVKRLRGGTNSYAALKACSELLRNSSSGLNPKALNRIVMITDGLFNMNKLDSIKQAFQLKLNDTDIFVIAVGRYLYGAPAISSLASTQESHVFRVKSMKGLVDVIKWNPYTNPWG
ncbi:integrin alpha-X-like [Actinia tenebrosa]|uniref:Integrin alpha-X-like n=1 Tax=Actinia tenebrosa TaxID=6105 RepID=A0A6P8HYC1_ACTTE|nr:integrin alpha-X-like [Actinia tenebrosa]